VGFRTAIDSGRATVYLEGRLSFQSYPDFKAATVPYLDHPEVKEFHLDMSAVDLMDSSALGMILHFRLKAMAAHKALAITRPAPAIAKILKVVNFGKLVTILP
jgi:HptB-dependent secretion and biofilm anti anti-sigma factor